MTRGWIVAAAVVAFVHAAACFLGAVGAGLTADNAEPMSTGEALGLAAVIALVALATVVGAILALTWRPWPLLGAAVASLAVSAYVAFRMSGTPEGYQLPLIFAVLPAVVVAAVVTGVSRRPRPVPA